MEEEKGNKQKILCIFHISATFSVNYHFNLKNYQYFKHNVKMKKEIKEERNTQQWEEKTVTDMKGISSIFFSTLSRKL